MKPKDFCKNCGGLMQLVREFAIPEHHRRAEEIIPCPVCKDSHGWDPVAWKKSQAAKPPAPSRPSRIMRLGEGNNGRAH
jgi:uncharacterized protein with PIN domain